MYRTDQLEYLAGLKSPPPPIVQPQPKSQPQPVVTTTATTIVAAKKRNEKPYTASIIVTSDTCCEDESKDESGTFVLEQLKHNDELFSQVTKRCVKDDKQAIVECLKKCLAEEDPALVITIGGTGLTPRDVTPDALKPLYERSCDGIVAGLYMTSLRYTPHAALSRLTAGIIGECLIINFPGSLKACKDCFGCVNLIFEHALEQVRFNAKAYSDTHLKLHALTNGSGTPQKLKLKEEVLAPDVDQISAGENAVNSLIKSLEKPVSQTKKKYFVPRKSVSPGNQSVQSNATAQANNLLPRVSRLSIQEVQASRAELQALHNQPPIQSQNVQHKPHQHQHPHARSASLSKKPWYHKKFTSLNDLRQAPKLAPKQAHPKPVINHMVPKIPLTKVPVTQSTFPMIEFAKAHEILGSLSGQLLAENEEVTLNTFETAFKLIGRVLTNDLRSRQATPPYAVSTMDGYVLHIPPPLRKTSVIKACAPARLLPNLEDFRAWQVHPQNAQSIFCYRVNTGGKLPPKNFAVVPIEHTGPVSDQGFVPILEATQGLYQRKPGSDLDDSDVLPKGTVIGPIEMSLILSMGHKKINVYKPPRIGVLSTGDEIVNFFTTQEVGPDQVVDTNGPLLSSMFRSRGYFCINCGIVKDEPNEIYASMIDALKKCDVLVVTGGASMGTKDYVKDVIMHMGGTIHFGGVNMKPGKPAAFASIVVEGRTKFIFSLPGNPVSAYITSLLLVIPFIEHGTKYRFNPVATMSLNCVGELTQVTVSQLIGEPYEFDGRLEFVRAKIINRLPTCQVSVSMQQQSSRVLSLRDCDCLLIVKPASKGQKFKTGDTYVALKFNGPL